MMLRAWWARAGVCVRAWLQGRWGAWCGAEQLGLVRIVVLQPGVRHTPPFSNRARPKSGCLMQRQAVIGRLPLSRTSNSILCPCARRVWPYTQELEQLNRIYAILGTPDEEVWPGVGAMPGARVAAQLPHHSGAQNLTPLLPKLGAEGGWCHLVPGCALPAWPCKRGAGAPQRRAEPADAAAAQSGWRATRVGGWVG